ncbi:MAG: acetylxylan esterase, partial [Planctomycetaceae bacterium]|nr:acetylxylan esterase [Planctomycetaceae bacterium]
YVYDLLEKPDALYHATFHWHHDYHQPIREAMYGWMAQHLKGEGNGAPIAEPPHQTEPVEELRLFPDGSRPDDWLTLPQFAGREGRKLLENRRQRNGANGKVDVAALRKTLIDKVLGGFPAPSSLNAQWVSIGTGSERRLTFEPELGITLSLRQPQEDGFSKPLTSEIVLLLEYEGAAVAGKSPLVAALQAKGLSVVTLDLRATGELSQPGDRIGRAPDHNTAEWSLWIGRPLLGQWTYDVLRSIEAIQASFPDAGKRRFHVIGQGPMGLVALCAGAASDQFHSVAAINTLASYVTDVPYEGQPLGIMAPGILRDMGDVADLAGLSQSRKVIVVGGVNSVGQSIQAAALEAQFARTAAAAQSVDKPFGFVLLELADSAKIAELLAE